MHKDILCSIFKKVNSKNKILLSLTCNYFHYIFKKYIMLFEFNFNYLYINNLGLSYLETPNGQPGIRYLSIYETLITDDGLKFLSNVHNLHTISIDNRITNKGLQYLSHVYFITICNGRGRYNNYLDYPDITAFTIDGLKYISNVDTIMLYNIRIDTDVLSLFSKANTLGLFGYPSIFDIENEDFKLISNVKHLKLGGMSYNVSIKCLDYLPLLKSVFIGSYGKKENDILNFIENHSENSEHPIKVIY